MDRNLSMSKPLQQACAVALACLATVTAPPAIAAPVTYDIAFTTAYGLPPTSGSFTYDSAAREFSNFTVLWNMITFDFTQEVNSRILNGYSTGGCATNEEQRITWFIPTTFVDCIPDSDAVSWEAQTYQGISYFSFQRNNVKDGSMQLNGIFAGADEAPSAGSVSAVVARVSTVPEPSTLALLGLSGLALGWSQRRRRIRTHDTVQ